MMPNTDTGTLDQPAAPPVTNPVEAFHQQRATCTIQEAMKELGVSRRTIYNWLERGKVQFVRTAGGSVRIVRTSLWRKADGSPV